MGTLLPYIFPLLLGRTFNLEKMQVGIDIFSKEEISKTVMLHNPLTETKYKVVESGLESRDLLDVGGSFSLKVKAKLFKGGASGDYLSDTYNRENVVEVTVRATYQMATEQLQPDVRPLSNWRSMGPALGTHFVRSLTYGGELIASMRMICNNTSDKQRVKAAFDVGGRIKIFDVGVEVEGEYIRTVSRAVDSTEIKVFSSIPLQKIPNDIESLREMLESFPEDLSRYNGGRGVPIKIELWPLEFFDASRTTKVSNRVLEAHLNTFEQKFDDLLNTKQAIADWMKFITRPLSQDQEKKVGKVYSKVLAALRLFYEVIGSLDSSLGIDQLQIALTAYGSNSNPGAYFKEYLALRQEVSSDQGEWILGRGGGATYTHWGRSNCNDLSETVASGVVFGSEDMITGLICLPTDEHFSKTKKNYFKGFSFSSLEEQENTEIPVPCSTCLMKSRSSVIVFPGYHACPKSWDHVYEGVLSNGRHQKGLQISSSFICLDTQTWNATSLYLPNWVKNFENGTLSTNFGMLIPCVMCAK